MFDLNWRDWLRLFNGTMCFIITIVLYPKIGPFFSFFYSMISLYVITTAGDYTEKMKLKEKIEKLSLGDEESY